MTTATLDYIELPAGDLPATKAFYSTCFGWSWIDYGPTYASHESTSLEIALNAEAAVAPTPVRGDQNGIGPFVLFSTDDLEAMLAAVVAAGGVVVSDPYGYPGGRRFHFTDPSGNVLGVYEPTQPADA